MSFHRIEQELDYLELLDWERQLIDRKKSRADREVAPQPSRAAAELGAVAIQVLDRRRVAPGDLIGADAQRSR